MYDIMESPEDWSIRSRLETWIIAVADFLLKHDTKVLQSKLKMDFAIDPALFGVAGPSTSSTGRVRDVPSLLQQHEAAKTTTRVPLLSSSGSSDEDDDEDEDEDGDSSSEDDSDDSSSADSQERSEDGSLGPAGNPARDKGKGKAREAPRPSDMLALPALPPMPPPLLSSSGGDLLPPLPPGLHPSHAAQYADTDVETDYAGAPFGRAARSQRTVGRSAQMACMYSFD